MKTFRESWAGVAGDLFAQALAGEPQFTETAIEPFSGGSFGFEATLTGDEEGRFSIALDSSILDTPLMGEGEDQKAGWTELIRETINAACGELLAQTGRKCRKTRFEPSIDAIDPDSQHAHSYQLRAGDRTWTILVEDELRASSASKQAAEGATASQTGNGPNNGSSNGPGNGPGNGSGNGPGGEMGSKSGQKQSSSQTQALTPGLDLLLDVELEATLRFGSREMVLGEVLELGPGDVVQLDRYITDTVDLLVGDKIVARGDVVLVNGNFGLRVTEVAQPKKRLESIRCLF